MPNSQDERALKRLVAELAVAAAADIEAVLASLGVQERDQVEALLEAYSGRVSVDPTTLQAEASERPVAYLNGLSPWLASRVKLSAGLGSDHTTLASQFWPSEHLEAANGNVDMTPTALRTLQRSATALAKTRQVDLQSGGSISWYGLATRIRQFMRGMLSPS